MTKLAWNLFLSLPSDISKILQYCNFFSLQQDGTEARKTKEEKELVYAKVVIRGKPVELFLKCQRMNDFGGVDAISLKKACDNAFETFGCVEEKFMNCLVSTSWERMHGAYSDT